MELTNKMIFQKLLKLTIMDALDHVWSETGITPSKKTRRTILKASEKISDDLQQDFVKVNKKQKLDKDKWNSMNMLTANRRPREVVPQER